MRKEFREHPELVNKSVTGEKMWTYDSNTNRITVGSTEAEPIKSLVHEITHWAMCGFLDEEENKQFEEIYMKLRSSTDCLSFYKISIEERTAEYIEEMVNE